MWSDGKFIWHIGTGRLDFADNIYHDEPILCFNHHPSKVVPEIVLNCVEL